MKRFYLRQLYYLILAMMLCLPVFQMYYSFLPKGQINGVETPAKIPQFTMGNYMVGEFQNLFTKWFNQNIGLRAYFLRNYNQLVFSVFGEAPSYTGVVVGKEGQLYEQGYIEGFVDAKQVSSLRELESKVKKLKKIQALLKKRGKAFLVVVTPSKAAIYPEFIPDRFTKNAIPHQRDYDRLILLMDQYGVNYVDGHKVTLAKKALVKYPLICRGGTHWNSLGAFYTTEQIIKKLELLLNKKLVTVQLDKVYLDNNPIGSDKDLAMLLNLWFEPLNYPTPEPVFSSSNKTQGFRPKILLEGGSFNFKLLDVLTQNKCYDIVFYYYNAIRYLYPGGANSGKTNLEKDLSDSDAVIMETNEHYIVKMGSGFIDDLLNNLIKAEDTVELKKK